jgi:FkbM family methyltransferase
MLALIRTMRHGPLRRWTPLWRLLGGLYRRVLTTFNLRTSVLTRIGPFGPFRLDGRFAFSNYKTWGGGVNAGFRACVEASSGARCVFDVGAHIGLVSLPISQMVAPGGKVFAFEPADFNRALLARHVKLNNIDNIEVLDSLVGEQDESSVAFFQQETDTGLNSVARRSGQSSFVEIPKQQVRLDTLCAQRSLAPDLMKIDVEGAEIGVLRGARETIARCRPLIFLSVHPEQIGLLGHDKEELPALIDEIGYICRDIDGSEARPLEAREYILHPRSDS